MRVMTELDLDTMTITLYIQKNKKVIRLVLTRDAMEGIVDQISNWFVQKVLNMLGWKVEIYEAEEER